MKSTHFLAFVICLIHVSECFSQNIKTVNSLPSPNATSLGLYGEVPVSLFSGTPQINIPIYELTSGSLKVPITLSYHGSGVRPDVHPGWVGSNMSLTAGGMITRVVKGVPDETAWEAHAQFLDSYNSVFRIGGEVGYFFATDKLAASDWSTPSQIETMAKSEDWKDTEPDEFSFNFNGYSGKFYLKENGQLVVISDPGIRVELEDTIWIYSRDKYLVSPAISNIGGYFYPKETRIKGFKITTPDGVQYEFGNWNIGPEIAGNLNRIASEASVDFFGETYFGIKYNTWYLKRIVDPNGENEIKFLYNYGMTNVGYGSEAAKIVSFTRNTMLDKKQGSSSNGIFKLFGPVSSSSTQLKKYYSGDLIYSIYLSKIETRDFEVTFSASPSTELSYNYTDAIQNLATVSDLTFSSSIHSITARLGITAINPNDPGVQLFTRGDINLSTANSTVLDFYTYSQNGNLIMDLPGFFAGNPSGSIIYEGLDLRLLKWFKLDKIDIKSKSLNEIVKSFQFTYSEDSDYRLMLLSMQGADKNGNLLPPYTFEYEEYNSDYYPGTTKLPVYNSGQVDHWGFFNGTDSEADFVTAADFNNPTKLNAYKVKRDPVPQYLYAGILNKIIYPTGGHTRFVYEPHQYVKTVTRNTQTGVFGLTTQHEARTAGGLRIKEIRSVSADGTPDLIKKYEYDGGILGGESKYYWPGYQGKLVNGDTYTADRFITTTVLPMSSNSVGSHIGYSKVIERQDNNGWTEYYYSNHDTYLDENFINSIDPEKRIYSPFTKKDFQRGQLLEKRVYNNEGNILAKEKNYFDAHPEYSGEFIRAVATQQIPILDGWSIEGTAYKVYSYPYNLIKTEKFTYQPSGENPHVATSTEFSYNSKNLVSQQKSLKDSDLEQITKYKYASDYVIDPQSSPTDVYAQAIQRMQITNQIATLIEEQRWHKKNGTEHITDGFLQLYSGSVVHPQKKFKLDVHSINQTEALSSINSSLQFVFSSNYTDNVATFEEYDNRGNLVQYRNEQNIDICYVYGYNSGFVIAEIIGAPRSRVKYTSFEEDLSNVAFDGVTGEKCKTGSYTIQLPTSPGKYIVSYWKKIGTGVWIFFKEEYNKVDTSIYSITLGGTDSRIDELRVYPKGAIVTSYTHKTGIGVIAKSDANDKITYYDYDNHGRLRAIKDENGHIIQVFEYKLKN